MQIHIYYIYICIYVYVYIIHTHIHTLSIFAVHCAFASPGPDAALQNLAGILNAGVLFESLKRRVADLRKNVKGASVELVRFVWGFKA